MLLWGGVGIALGACTIGECGRPEAHLVISVGGGSRVGCETATDPVCRRGEVCGGELSPTVEGEERWPWSLLLLGFA